MKQLLNWWPRLLMGALVLVVVACAGEDEDSAPAADALREPFPAVSNTLTVGNDVYTVGFTQTTAINQDAWVRKTTNGVQVYQRTLSTSPVDERGVLVIRDPATGDIWITIQADGGAVAGSVHNEAAAGAFAGVPFPTYGSGGSAAVTVLARIDPATGQIARGTYLVARLTNGNTNTFRVTSLQVRDGKVLVAAESAFVPPAAGSTASNFTPHPDGQDVNRINGAFQVRMQLPRDLSSLERVILLLP